MHKINRGHCLFPHEDDAFCLFLFSIVCYTYITPSKYLVLLIAEVSEWRDVEVVGFGDALRGLSARARVRRKSPLILPEVVMTAGKKTKLRSL